MDNIKTLQQAWDFMKEQNYFGNFSSEEDFFQKAKDAGYGYSACIKYF